MSFEARLLALESHIAQYDSVLVGIDKSVDLLVTEIRQLKCKVDIRIDELEGRFEHLNSRVCNIELTQAEHTVHMNHIEEKLEEHDRQFLKLAEVLDDIKQLLLERR